jgi:hypothetical protein
MIRTSWVVVEPPASPPLFGWWNVKRFVWKSLIFSHLRFVIDGKKKVPPDSSVYKMLLP